MDGTTAGNGPGPRIMEPVQKNVILASGDQVAIDAVAAKMMGFDPMTIDYIRIAHEQGLGVGDPREIEIVGDDAVGDRSRGASRSGGHLHSFLGWLTWYGPTKFLQKVVTATAARRGADHVQRGLPRLLPLAAEGEEGLRAVAARSRRGATSSPSTPPRARRRHRPRPLALRLIASSIRAAWRWRVLRRTR